MKLKLYVAGGSPNSSRARTNLEAALEEHGIELDILEIVDVFLEPGRALDDNVIVTPMLVRSKPEPAQRLVGTLDDAEVLRRIIDHD